MLLRVSDKRLFEQTDLLSASCIGSVRKMTLVLRYSLIFCRKCGQLPCCVLEPTFRQRVLMNATPPTYLKLLPFISLFHICSDEKKKFRNYIFQTSEMWLKEEI